MMSGLLMAMKPIASLVMMCLLLSGFAPPGSSAGSSNSNQPASIAGSGEFSVDDFDWREMVPYLYVAAGLPDEQGIKALLENSKVLRAYVASDVQAECRSSRKPCGARSSSFTLQGEVSNRIDQIVQEGTSRRHHITSVDYPLARQPFPFTDIAALKTEKHRDAYLVLDFADKSYTAGQLQDKYGPPYETNVIEWYSVYKYRLDTKNYVSRAAFEIDPVDGAVTRVAISLKRRDGHK
jgi:hypothetical protein